MADEPERQQDASAGKQAPDSEQAAPKPNDGLEVYNTVAETVGGVPSLRLKDNLIQAVIVTVATATAALVGFAIGSKGSDGYAAVTGALVGGVLGLAASTLISGIVLMVAGWVRSARKL